MTTAWDDRERRLQERYDHVQRAKEMIHKFVPVAEKYAKLSGIELPPKGDDEGQYTEVMYSFLNNAKFIVFALDECGMIFNGQMFRLGTGAKKITMKIGNHRAFKG